ncbi:MAG: hypothetical protein Kow0062_23060 [Acidobacteriota bacterium]
MKAFALLTMGLYNRSLLYPCPNCREAAVSKESLSPWNAYYWETRCRNCGVVVTVDPRWFPDGVVYVLA